MRSIKQTEGIFARNRAWIRNVAIKGFCFFGAGQNAALAFVTLKDWAERGPDNAAQAIAGRASMAMSQIKDAISFALSPPPIQGLGNDGRLHLPPAGSWWSRRGRAHAGARPTARPCRERARSCRRPLRRHGPSGAGRTCHRPRKGEHLRRDLRGYQHDDLDQSRLVLYQRLPECRPHAARDRAGGQNQRMQTEDLLNSTFATPTAAWCRSRPSQPSNG